jgi:alkylated DNA nucleotide flippase Atl1
LMGHPHRARQLERMLAHMAAQRSRVWFATPGQIADHVSALPEGTVA